MCRMLQKALKLRSITGELGRHLTCVKTRSILINTKIKHSFAFVFGSLDISGQLCIYKYSNECTHR